MSDNTQSTPGINTVGRRKTAVAKIFFKKGNGKIIVNKIDYKRYFPALPQQVTVSAPYVVTGSSEQYDVQASVYGGGFSGQAEALRLAISRALVKQDATLKPMLKKEGFLTRDPRAVERKKFGRKKARKRFQFSKR